MSFWSNLFSSPAPHSDTVVAPPPPAWEAKVPDALRAAAPQVDVAKWSPALVSAFKRFPMNEWRIAAALGQFAVEAGPGFSEVSEDLRYTHADRLCLIFKTGFPTIASTEGYVGNAEKIGNRAYANRNGNGNEASGDGYRFRGRGLIQITGRTNYTALAQSLGKTPEDAAEYCGTPEGAAYSGVWFLDWRDLWTLADSWSLTALTRAVNGSAMLKVADRINAANAARKVFGL